MGPSRGVDFRFIKKKVGSGFRLGDIELLLGSDPERHISGSIGRIFLKFCVWVRLEE